MRANRIPLAAGVALAASAALVMVPSAVQAGASAPTWTKQAPATSPPSLSGASMAYDAATHSVVLFGGDGTLRDRAHNFRETWTWNGTTWTKLAPAISPPGRNQAAMAYDAATRTVVLFGGFDGNELDDTWTWNGTTWTEQAPATSPPGVVDTSMVYDAATRTVLLFGGEGAHHIYSATWSWNGTTWTKLAPAAHPPALHGESMAYDAANHTVVIFGGVGLNNPLHPLLGGTWTWNGTTWAKQATVTHPQPRWESSMAYDAATGTAVLFGGYFFHGVYGDTWTWNGTTWTKQEPARRPVARETAAMAYDAANGTVVMFAGYGRPFSMHPNFRGTWTWG